MGIEKTFESSVVVVTGASSGIGKALAFDLANRGARVGLLARRKGLLDEVVEQIGADRAIGVVCDVSSCDEVEAAIAAVGAAFDRIDHVIVNAGVSMNGLFEETDLAVMKRMMDVNYFGSVHTAKWSYPWLQKSQGTITFISSVVGKRGFATRSGYSAAKFAVHGLFESLRVEWREAGIHVGLVAPGYTETEIRNKALHADGGTARAEKTSGKVMSAETAAIQIADAVARRKREVILTSGGKVMVWLNKLAPRLADIVASKVVG